MTGIGDGGVATYDVVADAYESWVGGGEVLADQTFVRLLGDITDQQVLALACGQGRDARLLADLGASVTALDVSNSLLDHAREHERQAPKKIVYLHDDAHQITSQADGSFDGVACYMSMMDIPELRPTLRSIARVLRPGGWVVLTFNHPCFKPPVAGELLDHRDGRVSRMVAGYFEEGPCPPPVRSHRALPSTTYHRMLSTYINELIAAGLVIELVAEPPLVDPDRPVWREVPIMLYLRCRRTAP